MRFTEDGLNRQAVIFYHNHTDQPPGPGNNPPGAGHEFTIDAFNIKPITNTPTPPCTWQPLIKVPNHPELNWGTTVWTACDSGIVYLNPTIGVRDFWTDGSPFIVEIGIRSPAVGQINHNLRVADFDAHVCGKMGVQCDG